MDWVKFLYERFFFRDVLGKITPGFMVAILVVNFLGVNLDELGIPDGVTWVFGIACLATSLLAGLALQCVGEFLGLHSPAPRPHRILGLPAPAGWRQVYGDFKDRLALWQNAQGLEESARSQRERFVSLKEGSGNLGLVLIVAIVASFKAIGWWEWALLVALATLLLLVHFAHAKRQAMFEIRVLARSKDAEGQPLLGEQIAEAMRKRIGDSA